MIVKNMKVEDGTLHELACYRDRLQVQVNANPKRFPAFLTEQAVSLSRALSYLLYQQASRGRRAKESLWNRSYETVPSQGTDAHADGDS